ncbi:MAG: MFS transporter [Thermomicrobiales bacterium]
MARGGRLTGLWRHPDFLKLWGGESVAFFGLHLTALALPLTAAVSLDATPLEMGILGAMGSAPSLVVGLFAGAWSDRLRRRPILLVANLVRAMALGTIPLAALFGLLHIAQLYVIAFITGCAGIFFMVAYQPYLGALVPGELRAEANGRLRFSEALAQIGAPSIGGALVQLLTAPITLSLSALAPFASFLAIFSIRAAEPPVEAPAARRSIWTEIGEGMRQVFEHRILQPVIASDALCTFFDSMVLAVYVLYATRELGISPGLLGGIMAVGGPLALIGALASGRVVRTLGLGPTLVAALIAAGLAATLLPLAGGSLVVSAALFVGWRGLTGFAQAIYTVNFYTIMQTVPPPRLQGRVNATARVFIWGAMAVGALAGGALGQWLGLRPTLIVAAVGMLCAPLGLLLSPVRGLREQPAAMEQRATA